MANKILMYKNNQLCDVTSLKIDGLSVNFLSGNNNTVIIGENNKLSNIRVMIEGNYNTVTLGSNLSAKNTTIMLLSGYNNRTVSIGDKTYIGEAFIQGISDGSSVEIGRDCMLSTKIKIVNHFGVEIYDKKTNEKLFNDHRVIIGDHVWIGRRAFIGPSTVIASNSIIGTGSFVTGVFAKSYCSIAGNPAKKIKENVDFLKCWINNFDAGMSAYEKRGNKHE